ncbi:E3 ubiquitin-protein ligase RMA3-like [Silene latifolia]|uniref:E3 ubiquitin-protein ligase RMA3-like n=1 Tax=Silene latifolia TaxID=37657 RepID=UPI003D777F86
MDLIQDLQDHATETISNEDSPIKPKYDSASIHSTESGSSESSFSCSICFDTAQDPVVTLCGHLYCWACIFKWLHIQTSSTEPGHHQACPVCKASISQASLIPLYCNGPSRPESNIRNPPLDVIPPRPTSCGVRISNHLPPNLFQPQSPAFHHQQYFSDPNGSYAAITSSNLVSTTMAGIINPTIGLLGELVNPRMAGNPSMFTFPIPTSYAVVWQNNARTRRHEMQLDKSLNRVSIFLFCGLILCLLLF